jgi:hypothetical protein
LPQSGRRDGRARAGEAGAVESADVVCMGLPMVSSVSGRRVGELHLEFPLRVHGITAPLRSELESLKRLWVTEKNEISLPSE